MRPVVVALLASATLAACGGNSAPATKHFSSTVVPFAFDYPAALQSCPTFGNAIAILGYCESTPNLAGISTYDYVGVGKYGKKPIPSARLRGSLEKIVPSYWRTVRIEQHSGMTMVVADGQKRAGYPYSLYVFPLAGAEWRIDCSSSPTHLNASLAACRQAVESIKPTSPRG